MTTDKHRGRGWAARHEIVLYLVLAYAVSWCIWPLVLLNPGSSPLVPFGPGLAAVLVAFLAGGRRELINLLRQLWRWRVNFGWYAMALSVPFAVPGLARLAAVMAGAPALSWEPSDALQVASSIAVTIVIVGIFEELGWRGFLLPRLQVTRNALASALMVALVWLPWHLPELVSDPGQRPLVPFAVYIGALSVILAWLYNCTRGSLPVVILFHAAFNSFTQFFLAELQGGDQYLVAWWTLAGLGALLAVAITVYPGHHSLVTVDERGGVTGSTAGQPPS
ncbi:CPBP family intramembrane glutamic endopeptidase [Arthrobacter sp. P2b]|uniref:CPBP family intramembrane glutamic endopeptidase n=1 Tax=Arthrobacter sp. P2b TaxID=1938741 RepID=UPI0009CF9963|nr:type II CAAX endopeptidase family protein [Arthrobacter sp. P2b]SLJ94881.1 Membrane protease YdiL, CAAX protease family [Arthrobacter sp. P2b]